MLFLGTDDWRDLVDGADTVPQDDLRARMATLDNNQPINIQYTSGTTGFPKGATLSHRNILNNGYFTTELLNFGPDDRLCIPVPFYHCFGMVLGNLGCTSHGTTMVIPAPGFDPGLTLDASKRKGAQRFTACRRCSSRCSATRSRQPRPVVAAHRHHGRVDLSRRGDEARINDMNMTEFVHRVRDDRDVAGVLPDPASTTTSNGVPARSAGPTRTWRSRSSTRPPATIVERGQPGEFCTRGYSVMLGYWQDEAKTREAIDADGWMHTGDLAVMRTTATATSSGASRTW